jgi:hypothetical protein
MPVITDKRSVGSAIPADEGTILDITTEETSHPAYRRKVWSGDRVQHPALVGRRGADRAHPRLRTDGG